MCGRFALTSSALTLGKQLNTDIRITLKQRFNIAPSQKVLVVRVHPRQNKRESTFLRWGLIPSWADDPSIGSRLTNARAETAATKPSFRTSFRRQRCLIPANGFYEWSNMHGRKQPHYIRLQSNEPFAFGGLWDTWARDGEKRETCTILTCSANALMKPIHPRMPVVIQPHRFDTWLDPTQTDAAALSQDLHTFPSESTAIYPVSNHVNNVQHDDSRCQEQCLATTKTNTVKTRQSYSANQLFLFDR